MMNWKQRLKFDPIPGLMTSKDEALKHLASRDLANGNEGSTRQLWELLAVTRLAESQKENGAWKYRGGREDIRSSEDYDQIETFRVLRFLVEKYGLNRDHPVFSKAAEFMFSHQTGEGDFRGIAGKQYVPYYSGAIMELLIKGGYAGDHRIERGFNWLSSIRQDDGGWAFPMRTAGMKLSSAVFKSKTVQPDRRKPSSHLVTGMVLRAYAAHPSYRGLREAKVAGELLAARFFKPDAYPDRRAEGFWTSFSYPFWFTDLLSSLDSLSMIGFDSGHPRIRAGIDWFISRQRNTGLWNLQLRIMAREKEPNHWITLAICRVLKRLYD